MSVAPCSSSSSETFVAYAQAQGKLVAKKFQLQRRGEPSRGSHAFGLDVGAKGP